MFLLYLFFVLFFLHSLSFLFSFPIPLFHSDLPFCSFSHALVHSHLSFLLTLLLLPFLFSFFLLLFLFLLHQNLQCFLACQCSSLTRLLFLLKVFGVVGKLRNSEIGEGHLGVEVVPGITTSHKQTVIWVLLPEDIPRTLRMPLGAIRMGCLWSRGIPVSLMLYMYAGLSSR